MPLLSPCIGGVRVDDLLALAPDGVTDSFLQLAVPMVAAGAGLVLLFWFLGGLWSVVLSIFEL